MTKVVAFLDKKFFPVMTNDFGKLSEICAQKCEFFVCSSLLFLRGASLNMKKFLLKPMSKHILLKPT